MSAVLLILAVQTLLLAAVLLRAGGAKLANAYLAALLVVLVGMATPFIIGYAGAYDAYPWLSFAPFAAPLAIGPLLYGYVTALTNAKKIALYHFAPAALYFLCQAIVFVQPLAWKDAFHGAVQAPYLDPLLLLAFPVSLLGYAYAAWRVAQRYEKWVEERRRSPIGLPRLRIALLVLVGLGAARLIIVFATWAVGLVSYFDLFAFYLALGAVSVWLGVEGWRGAERAPAPQTADLRDWRAQGEAWSAAIVERQLWRDADASLDTLAKALATNRATLSRALNAAGASLPALLARARADEVARQLSLNAEADLLDIALEAGFGSKAAFNRAFRARFGVSPSDYRAGLGAQRLQ